MEKAQPSYFSPTDLVDRLRSTDLFSGLDAAMLNQIASGVEWFFLPARETLFRQGDIGDGLYILINGRLRLFVEREGKEEVIDEIVRGEIVGEISLLTGEPRSATVRAIRDSNLVKFSIEACHKIVENHPSVMFHLAKIIARRLGARNRPRVGSLICSLALVPLSRGVPIRDFTTRFAAALNSIGLTLHLNKSRFDHALGKGSAESKSENSHPTHMNAWLNEQEEKCQFILFESGPEVSEWTKKCIRQADHVVLLGQAGEEPALSQIESILHNQGAETSSAQKTLILIHPNGNQPPTQTQLWLAGRQVDDHYHLRLDSNTDFDRLARIFSGRGTGLVLGGGGARGFAHMGAIRAIQEAGIPIDFIGGTSMGAAIAGEFAIGFDCQTMIKVNTELFHRSSFDYTFPVTSLLAARQASNKLFKIFGDTKIEDLWVPYFCVSADLTRAETKIHKTGSLRRGIRASTSLPGITPPISDGRNLLVDGGLLNALPIDEMSKFCRNGLVIAVDVSAQVDLANDLHLEDSLSGWKVLWSRVNPFCPTINVPNIASVLHRAGELSTIHGRREMLDRWRPDLYLRPPVEKYGILAFGLIDQIADVGFQFTKEKLKNWTGTKENA